MKVEEETGGSMNEVRIGAEHQDGIMQLKGEGRLRIRRAVVGFCRNPESQLAKLLSLPNL